VLPPAPIPVAASAAVLLLLLLCLCQVGLWCVKLDGGMSLEQRNRTIDEFTHNPGAA
jgi:hypothetical protein